MPRKHEPLKTFPRRLRSAMALRKIKRADAADVVPVVRCRDCKYMEKEPLGSYCNVWGFYNGAGDEGFCNYGEKMDLETG